MEQSPNQGEQDHTEVPEDVGARVIDISEREDPHESLGGLVRVSREDRKKAQRLLSGPLPSAPVDPNIPQADRDQLNTDIASRAAKKPRRGVRKPRDAEEAERIRLVDEVLRYD